MKRRSFLRGLVSAPLVAAVASLPVAAESVPMVPSPAPVKVEAERQRVLHEAWQAAEYRAEEERILREAATANVAVVQAMVRNRLISIDTAHARLFGDYMVSTGRARTSFRIEGGNR